MKEKVYLAHTLEETAKIAVDLANNASVKANYFEAVTPPERTVPEGKVIKGLYSGGTLAAEAGMLISEALGLEGLVKEEGYILKSQGYDIIDLGDDIYTQGKPHPMIDPEVRVKKIKEYAQDASTGILLVDIVLGYGAHEDMVGALLPAIKDAQELNPELQVVATVVGTDKDPQNYQEAVQRLQEQHVLVAESNAKAVQLALRLKGIELTEADKPVVPYQGETIEIPYASPSVAELLNTKPRVINVGLQSFNESIQAFDGKSIQFNWKPRAGGNKKMIHILNALEEHADKIEKENQQVMDKIKNAQPFLTDIVPAKCDPGIK